MVLSKANYDVSKQTHNLVTIEFSYVTPKCKIILEKVGLVFLQHSLSSTPSTTIDKLYGSLEKYLGC